jgi:hypothetical protein
MDSTLSSSGAAADEYCPVFMSRRRARALEKKLLVSPRHRNVNASLRRVCYTLYDVLKQSMRLGFVPEQEFTTLTYCGKILKNMGLQPRVNAETDKSLEDMRLDVIRHSFDYRNIRNKMVASLSIIADLPSRGVSAGTEDFQAGMREGYKRASQVAVMFLDDLLVEE